MYENASGKKVSRGKSSIFFSSNVIEYNKNMICNILMMTDANESTKYLGLHNLLGRNKSCILGYLKEKVAAKIRSWDANMISRTGKEVMIRSVAQSLQHLL